MEEHPTETVPLEKKIPRPKGGAAPIVFWVICFLSIAVSIQFFWQTPC